MELKDIVNTGPLIIAVMMALNGFLVGLHAAMSKIVEAAESNPFNMYLNRASLICKSVIKFLDVFGYNPGKRDLNQAMKLQKRDIEEIKHTQAMERVKNEYRRKVRSKRRVVRRETV